MNEQEVLGMLIARKKNYGITEISHVSGRAYSVVMNGRRYNAIIVVAAFEYYEFRYHLAKNVPNLVVCSVHDTVVPVGVLSLKDGRVGNPFDLPAQIRNVVLQRHRSKTGSQCLLGMYLSGMREAPDMIARLPKASKNRYLARARELSKRRPGRPVNA